MPKHEINKSLGMSRDRFMFIWRFFHVGSINKDVDNQPASIENDGDEIVEIGLEQVQVEQDEAMTSNDEEEEEDKKKPLADNALSKGLLEKGYKVARRTVAKYREQMNFPVARLRKEL